MPLYTTESINLRSSRFAEADKLMTFFTKSRGKIKAVAKSACKAGSKFGGRLEPLAYNKLLLAKGKNLDILSQAETIETFQKVRENESSLKAAFYMARITDSFLETGHRDIALFNMLLDCLYMLKAGISPGLVVRIFDIKFADVEGFLPMDDFTEEMRSVVCDIQAGNISGLKISAQQLRQIDSILMFAMCEHVGKDVRNWKNM